MSELKRFNESDPQSEYLEDCECCGKELPRSELAWHGDLLECGDREYERLEVDRDDKRAFYEQDAFIVSMVGASLGLRYWLWERGYAGCPHIGLEKMYG